MSWDKDADFIPLDNAIAQVKMWKTDLRQAESFLEWVEELMSKHPTLDLSETYDKAFDDVQTSREGLTNARLKLEESKNNPHGN